MSHHPLRRLASAAALPSRARVALVADSEGIITLPAQGGNGPAEKKIVSAAKKDTAPD